MTYIAKPKPHHPSLAVNELGLTRRDYEGATTTLCAGCGHDAVSAAIIQASAELSIEPHKVAKISGIGCSSKTPTYFLGKSHGFNSVHGRMPSVATGANMANRELLYVGVSGDGDSASIGLGQFAHVVRRQLNMVYITANNGTYGLTKGQFSATNDIGSLSKKGEANLHQPIDLVTMALNLGASFVARSFSGDKEQLVPLLKAAMRHRGFAFIDVISPCVMFNNHEGSTRSYASVRRANEALSLTDFVPAHEQITTDYAAGEVKDIALHDGSLLRLSKLATDYNPVNKLAATEYLARHSAKGELVTGLIYINNEAADFHDVIDTPDQPLNSFGQSDLCPGADVLSEINQSLR